MLKLCSALYLEINLIKRYKFKQGHKGEALKQPVFLKEEATHGVHVHREAPSAYIARRWPPAIQRERPQEKAELPAP